MSAKKPITLPALSICLPSDFKFEELDKRDPGSLRIFKSNEPNLGLDFSIDYCPDEGVVYDGEYWAQTWTPDNPREWEEIQHNIPQVLSWPRRLPDRTRLGTPTLPRTQGGVK